MKLKIGQISLVGFTESGQGSLVILENHRICFDCGLLPPEYINSLMRCNTICITHGHADHIGALHMDAFIRGLKCKQNKVTYIMPEENIIPWTAMYSAARELNGNTRFIPRLLGVQGEEQIPLKNSLVLYSVQTVHRVTSVGYVLVEKRSKLLPELRGYSSDDLKVMHQAGKEITQTTEVPIFAYTGDTQIEGILSHDKFLKAQVLMMECTFVDDQVSVQEARKRGHIHLDELVQSQQLFQNEHIVLCHFSPRYDLKMVKSCIDKAAFTEEFRQKIHLFM